MRHTSTYHHSLNGFMYVLISLLSLTLISFFILSSNITFADSRVDEISVTIETACTMTGTGMNSHTATISPGTYEDDIGITTLKAFCNDANGFAIYAAGYTGDEIGGTNSTKLVNSAASTNNTINTGTDTTGSISNWAMKLNTNSSDTYPITLDNSFGSYHVVPNTYTKVAHRDSATDVGNNATGSTLTTTYAAAVASTQAPGTYAGKVIYTLVHPSSEIPPQPQPATAGCINYFANTSTAVGEMGCQSASNNASVTLWASNFSRAGYGFAGWSDAYDYATNNNAHFYGPNQTITAPSDVSTKGLSLYAVWIKSAGTIQNWNGCSSLTKANEATDIFSESITALTDERDGNTYAIAKLADGKCWTIENLRLADKDSSNNDIDLSSTNTHNPSLPLTNSWWYSTDNNSDTAPTSNHLSATTDPTQTAWCTTNSSNCDDQSMLATNNTTLFINNTASGYSASSNVYSYGNYYNWYSATAGHGKYGSSYGSSFTAPGDICPAGWHLPTGKDASGDFGVLDIALGGTGASSSSSTTPTGATMSGLWRSYPNNFVYSGYAGGSSVNDRSSSGYYWSASGDSSGGAYYLLLYSMYVYPGTGNFNKYYGWMVRCVAGV